MHIDYIFSPEETPNTRNNDFYHQVSYDWQKRAKKLQDRRWEKIDRTEG